MSLWGGGVIQNISDSSIQILLDLKPSGIWDFLVEEYQMRKEVHANVPKYECAQNVKTF